jgi:error-prone DNA polymerase
MAEHARDPFVHLHAHSNYSFLDGASSPEALARHAATLGQDTLALTDWSGLHGAIPFDRACRDVGVRPLFGAEIALAGADGQPGRHLTLLVRDAAGWASLCRLLTSAHLAGHKGFAPVAAATLAAHAAGLTCLSGCRHGVIAAPLLADDEGAAWHGAAWLRDLFGDDLWVELPLNARPDERLLAARLGGIADRLGVGVVATANVHYAAPADGPLADTLACIRAGTTLAAARHLRPNHAYHLASGAELAARCPDRPEALANTRLVADRCAFALAFGPHRFPTVPVSAGAGGGVELTPDNTPDATADEPPAATPDARLRALCHAGLTERYADGDPALWRRAARQLAEELAVIADLGLAPFFLLVADVVRFARARDIPCQGRGSATGSVVAYTLGVARVEPLGQRLLFARFLSRERGSLPDIDLDFGHARREEVVRYLYATYGAAHVGMACTIQTYHTRGAVRDVGKALGLPAPVVEAVARRVRQRLDADLAGAVRAAVGDEALALPVWGHLVALCARLVGTPRHLGIHNGGVVVTGPPLGDLVPLERATMPGRVVVQWDKDALELAGLIKLDVLSLQALDLAYEAARLVREHEGAALDLARLPDDDPATYDLLCAADTIGCFQVESRAQQAMLPLHRPRTFADLVAQISIVRPGPIQSGMVHPYLRRRLGEEPVGYAHPSLEPVLRATLGVMLFQEDILEVARTLAGFSLGAGDELRRAMGSQRSTARMAALRERFLAGAAANGVAEAVAVTVFTQIEAFAGYGFPRSHAVAFARLAYETAWLKAHHPAAFYCARLNAQPGGFYAPGVVVGDARRHGIAVRGPDLARSAYDCTLERAAGGDLAVRLGLCYVRGLAETTGTARAAECARRGPFRIGPWCPVRCVNVRVVQPRSVGAFPVWYVVSPWR